MKQTAVEWLASQVIVFSTQEVLKTNIEKLLEEAKEIENQQIIDFANYCVELQYESFQTGEDINAKSMEDLLEKFKNK